MCDDNRNYFIAILHNVLLAPDLYDSVFSIIMLMNLGHTCLFHKEFCMVCLDKKKKNVVTFTHSAQRKHSFWGEIKQMSKSKKIEPRKKLVLELLHYRSGNRYTR